MNSEYLNMLYIGICLIPLLILSILLIQFLFKKEKKIKPLPSITSDQYIVIIHSIKDVVDQYRLFYFDNDVNTLKSKFDICPDSRTNAINAFNIEYKTILNKAVHEIITIHLSKDIIRFSSVFFTTEALTLFIINQLQTKN